MSPRVNALGWRLGILVAGSAGVQLGRAAAELLPMRLAFLPSLSGDAHRAAVRNPPANRWLCGA
jgi:hypothetical protein